MKSAKRYTDWKTVIDEAVGVLSSSSSAKQYFKHTIASLEERKDRYVNSGLLVGLIGATSSGKSKVVNSLLSEDLLPVRVGPSSGVGVWCSNGNGRQAVIRFSDGHEKILSGSNLTSRVLQDFADERFNPKNSRRVQSIDITSPAFAFPKGITVIDTPGLDADGFEDHEEMTLRFLLPLLDVCVIVITAKPNSDESFRNYLTSSLRAKKETIVLQNMIDAIEPDHGLGGRVSKDLSAMRSDLIERIHKNLRRIPIDPNSIHIVQASARERLNSRLNLAADAVDGSGMQQLIDIINQTYILDESRRGNQRLSFVREYLESEAADKRRQIKEFAGKNSDRKKRESQNKAVEGEIARFHDAVARIDAGVEGIEKLYQSAIERASELGERDVDKGYSLWRLFLVKLDAAQSDIIETMAEVDRDLPAVLTKLFLDPNDFRCARPSVLQVPENIPDLTGSKTYKRTVDKPGWFAKLKRKAGGVVGKSWGKKELDVHIVIFEVGKLLEEMKKTRNRFRGHFVDGVATWKRYRTPALGSASRELNRIMEDTSAHRQRDKEYESIGLALANLKRLTGSIVVGTPHGSLGSMPKSRPEPFVSPSRFDVSPVTLSMIFMASKVLAHEFLTIRRYCETTDCRSAIVWGWNDIALAAFVERFYGPPIAGPRDASNLDGYREYLFEGKKVAMVDQTRSSLESLLSSGILRSGKETIIYCLVPMDQYGLGLKLFRAAVMNNLDDIRTSTFVPVIESVHSSYLGGAMKEIGEVFVEFCDELKEYNIPVDCALVNHSSPLFSKLLMARISMPQKLSSKHLGSIKRIADANKHLSTTPAMKANTDAFIHGLTRIRS